MLIVSKGKHKMGMVSIDINCTKILSVMDLVGHGSETFDYDNKNYLLL